ncbi:uncharacterized protein EV420DRAFT_1650085 [Desarmillaria tabescens]|uniref:Uncharacterized protein n=1 Tax=Armillaria tabescens TaxID=1929756 RepID=A0AA39JJB0_ARMTA|nr:uncharacterized protein EV420DRAFT_1650085 [Desarmillaria tabescens]KAK0441478.1 hypothetical protein EV420DRAFT_1650085 [Desarmillaria tabescens]
MKETGTKSDSSAKLPTTPELRKTHSSKELAVVNVKRITRVGKTNALEIQTRRKYLTYQVRTLPLSNNAAPVPPIPPTDIFPKLSAEARALQDKFNSFIQGTSIGQYAESLLRAYFKSNSKCQGQISIFVDPLQDLYELQDAYTTIQDQSLEVEGLSVRHNSLVQAGGPINKVIKWVEDFWHCTIDGPGSLLCTYNVKRLAWQRDTIS